MYYTCIFRKMVTVWGAMREPLQNLIPDIRAVTVTCNNCSTLACFFKARFHFSQCNPKSQFCPFPIIFVKAKEQREREKCKKDREESYLLLPCFGTIKEGNRDNTSSSTSSFLDFRHQRGEGKNFSPYIFSFYIFFYRGGKGKKKKPFLFLLCFSLLSAFERFSPLSWVHG